MSIMLIVVPLLFVLLLNLLPRKTAGAWSIWVGLGLALIESCMALVLDASAWDTSIAPLLSWFPLPAQAGTALGRVMYLAIGLVAATTFMVNRQVSPDPNRRFIFDSLVLLALAGMNGIVLSRDLFSLYVFIEVTAVASYILIASDKSMSAFEGAFKYVVLSAVATSLMLAGIGLLLFTAGGTSFGVVRTAFENLVIDADPGVWLKLTAFVLFLVGLLIKSGLIPFHGWLPDAYSSAPAPVSVLLAGIVTKATGV